MDRPYSISDFAFPSRWEGKSGPNLVERAGQAWRGDRPSGHSDRGKQKEDPSEDPNLAGSIDPVTFLAPSGFRRTTGERAAPPYIGRGVIEAVPDAEILANEAVELNLINSSLDRAGDFPECGSTDCLNGRHNQNTSNQAFVGGHTDTRVGRLGLRAAGPTLMQFMIGGSQGELGFTSPLLPTEPTSMTNPNRPGCAITVTEPNIPLSTPFCPRALIRLVAPPEFGKTRFMFSKGRIRNGTSRKAVLRKGYSAEQNCLVSIWWPLLTG